MLDPIEHVYTNLINYLRKNTSGLKLRSS